MCASVYMCLVQGNSAALVPIGVRVFAALGAKVLLVTNAAGAANNSECALLVQPVALLTPAPMHAPSQALIGSISRLSPIWWSFLWHCIAWSSPCCVVRPPAEC